MKQLAKRYYKYAKTHPYLFHLISTKDRFTITDIPSWNVSEVYSIFNPHGSTSFFTVIPSKFYRLEVLRTCSAIEGKVGTRTFESYLAYTRDIPYIPNSTTPFIPYPMLNFQPVTSIQLPGASNES